MAEKHEDNDQGFTNMDIPTRVRKRPAVIFGSGDVEGCQRCVYELILNAVKETRECYGDKIVVTKYLDGSFEVQDFGRGIPVGYNERYRHFNWAVAFSEENYTYPDGDSSEYALALTGFGLSSTQYVSEYMDA